MIFKQLSTDKPFLLFSHLAIAAASFVKLADNISNATIEIAAQIVFLFSMLITSSYNFY